MVAAPPPIPAAPGCRTREREAVDGDTEPDRHRSRRDLTADFAHQGRPRKSSIAPTVVAIAAPSRIPRRAVELEERERVERRSRGAARSRRAAARDGYGRAGSSPAGRRPEEPREPPTRGGSAAARPRRQQNPQMTSGLSRSVSRLLLRAVEAVSGVSEPGRCTRARSNPGLPTPSRS